MVRMINSDSRFFNVKEIIKTTTDLSRMDTDKINPFTFSVFLRVLPWFYYVFVPAYCLLPTAVYAQGLEPLHFPLFGNRTAIWIIAQFHILFASFILGVPLFVVIAEYLYMRKGDYRYERLAKDIARVMAIAYSITALSGGTFAFLLFGLYPDFSYHIINQFAPLWLLFYPGLVIIETILMYLYYFSWEPLKERKGIHLSIGILLNIVGILTLFNMDAIASYMNTPPRHLINPTIWENVYNYTWMPLNIHRLVGNITYGGYMVGMMGAFLYVWSDNKDDRAYYDWMGYIGNSIGVGAMLVLPIMGYIYAKEFYRYAAELGTYMMSDRLSMYFEAQAIVVGLLFLSSNYYIWLSMKRIEGASIYTPLVRFGFIVVFFSACIWFIPRHYFATMAPEEWMYEGMTKGEFLKTTELPSHLGFLALMKAKNTAAVLLVLVTLLNYIIYRRAIKRGRIEWGKIDFRAQYVLIFLGFSDIWLMNLMGAVRALVRKDYHVYLLLKDTTLEAYTPTLAYASSLTTAITLSFFSIFVFIVWLGLRFGKEKG